MLCNASPRRKQRKQKKKKKTKKKKKQRGMITKNREMKHENHVRNTQLDQAFCIQNLLDATLALELLFIFEC